MPAPRRIPPVRPSPGSEESGSAARQRDSDALGKLLLQAGAVTRENLDKALAAQRKNFMPLGRILQTEYGLGVEALATALKKQAHIPRVYLRFFPVQKEAISLLDADFCRQHETIAFERLGKLLCVAISNPSQRNVIREIEAQTGLAVKAFQAPWDDISKKLSK